MLFIPTLTFSVERQSDKGLNPIASLTVASTTGVRGRSFPDSRTASLMRHGGMGQTNSGPECHGHYPLHHASRGDNRPSRANTRLAALAGRDATYALGAGATVAHRCAVRIQQRRTESDGRGRSAS